MDKFIQGPKKALTPVCMMMRAMLFNNKTIKKYVRPRPRYFSSYKTDNVQISSGYVLIAFLSESDI